MQLARDPVETPSCAPRYEPTSAALARLLENVPEDRVSLSWLMGTLEERSFGFFMLIVALIGLVPGIATLATLLLPFLAVQMLLGREGLTLPRFLANKSLSSHRFSAGIARLVPLFVRVEVFVRPRWWSPFERTRPVIGGVVLILGLTTLAPFPFYQIPTFAIALIAFACLEEDGILLCIAMLVALFSLAFSAASLVAAIKAIGIIGKL